jgi:hypothetical protein
VIEYKLVSSFYKAEFNDEVNRAAAEGWTIYSWHVTPGQTFYAMMERQKSDS